MLRIYRVTADFEAAQLRTEPTRIEIFHAGDLLIVIGTEGAYTTFCRHDDAVDLSTCAHFVMTDAEFAISTEIAM